SPFKKGPFMLAINSGIPILPVSIKGTYAILPKGQLWVNPGTVTLVIHPPVETAGVTGGAMRDQLIETVHQAICEGFYENA
ncbi:MAG TPA: lysophospholipid acyltransferase family protein, partial [Calditrichia bacterium]|nr:lysophospholipid acyltransferase family protein [Calditrichia bacterium]